MKCKVRLTYSVDLVVEGNSEDEIYDWLNNTTPEEAYHLADGDVDENYEEEILCVISNDVSVDYVIE